MTSALDISIVLYHPDPDMLRRSLGTLADAVSHLAAAGVAAKLWIVDNGSEPADSPARRIVDRLACTAAFPMELLTGHGNVGYGAGHNLAIRRGSAPYHLILNYDILLEPDSLLAGWRFLEEHPGTVLLSPKVFNGEGEQEFLCKRMPTVFDLALRAFAPASVKRRFRDRLDRYEMRDVTRDEVVHGLEQVSGAFMLFRREALARLNGFDDGYFLYFEDFDLSRRAARIGDVAFVPTVRLVHFGGKAARKGRTHIKLFARSALRFFNSHGWRLI